MYESYRVYCNEVFKQLIKEASKVSKQLAYDIQIMDISYLYNHEEWIVNRNNELIAN